MIRVASTGDLHWDHSGSRWNETVRVHEWMTADMRSRGVELVTINGDWLERASKIEERNAICKWLQEAGIDIFGVRGNHDPVADLAIFNQVRSLNKIFIEEGVSVQIHNGIAIAMVAWPRKAQLLATLKSEVGKEESEQMVREHLRIMFLHLRDELKKHDGPRILSMHAQVCGAVTSVGQPLTGADIEVSLQQLALVEADIVFLSHIHKPQEWTEYPMPIIYCGSPYATAYGETEEKSYVLAEFYDTRGPDGKILQSWTRIPTPRTPMVLLETRYLPDSGAFYYLNDVIFDLEMVQGADVRFRYSADSDYAAAAKAAAKKVEAEFIAAGALVVKLEETVNSTTRARAPEVVEAQTLPDKLEVLWHVRQVEVEAERKQRLFDKASHLETEVRNAAA